MHNNPASIVNSPLKWDMAIFGFQEKHTTNLLKIIKNDGELEGLFPPGTFKRHADLNFNINLLNTRIALNRRSAIAFGVNLKSYSSFQTGTVYFSDTLGSFADFFQYNEDRDPKSNFSSSTWAEVYLSYGRTIFDNEIGRLNAGITLKLNKGLAGGFASLRNVSFNRTGSSPLKYNVNSGEIDYGYFAGYDILDDDGSANDFLASTRNNGSLDIGLEYLVKLPSIPSVFDNENLYDYDWKIGVSVLDIGYTKYPFGTKSTRAKMLKPGNTDSILDEVLGGSIDNLQDLQDSLGILYNSIGTYTGNFGIGNPARIVLNVDKYLMDAFFINADLSVDLSFLSKRVNRPVRDINLLTVTPRWETRKKGFYLPIYYNNHNQVWVGGAVRMGPVLLGIHNWNNVFSKKKLYRGGLYLTFLLRASDYTRMRYDKRLNCP